MQVKLNVSSSIYDSSQTSSKTNVEKTTQKHLSRKKLLFLGAVTVVGLSGSLYLANSIAKNLNQPNGAVLTSNCTEMNELMSASNYCPTEFFLKYFDGVNGFNGLVQKDNRAKFNFCWNAKELTAANTTGTIFNMCSCNPGLVEFIKEFGLRFINLIYSNSITFEQANERYAKSELNLLSKLGCSFNAVTQKTCTTSDATQKEFCEGNISEVKIPVYLNVKRSFIEMFS